MAAPGTKAVLGTEARGPYKRAPLIRPAPLGSGAARVILAASPYAAVLVGLYIFRSAWAALLLYHAGILAALLALRSHGTEGTDCAAPDPKRPGQARVPGRRVRTAACFMAAVLAGASGGAALYLLWPLVRLAPLEVLLARWHLAGASWIALAAWYAAAHPFLEEALWRGLLYTPRRGLAWEDLAFAGYHLLVLSRLIRLPWAVLAVAVLAGTAWSWRRSIRWSGRRDLALASHAAAGIGTMAAAFLLLSAGM